MPATTQTPVRAWAHCTNPRCPGHEQEEVDALQVETSFFFSDNGGNIPGVERSSMMLVWADPEQSGCRCGRTRDLSDSRRRQYDNLSGFDPDGLLEMQAQGVEFDPAKQIELRQQPVVDEERERLEAENAQMRERLAKLEGFMLGKQSAEDE